MTKTQINNIVLKILDNCAGYGFKPNQEFYEKAKINSKRFGLLTKGKLTARIDELQSICSYFNVSLKDFVD